MSKKLKIICGLVVIALIFITVVIVVNKRDINADEVKAKKQITISVFDKENTNIFKKNIETDKTYLIDVLKEIDRLDVVTEDSDYGEYIISIMGIEQGDNYYWTYYIDDDYAPKGVSACKIDSGKEYSFKIEGINY